MGNEVYEIVEPELLLTDSINIIIVGKSGTGKSTVIKALMGIRVAEAGEVGMIYAEIITRVVRKYKFEELQS